MKIAIVGAGIIGVATAYELSADGHAVTVFERRGAAAEEGSFAGAGLATAAWAVLDAGPATPASRLWKLLRGRARLRLATPLSLRELGWAWRWLRSGRTGAWHDAQQQLLALSGYGQARLRALTLALELDYDRSEGQLLLLRTAAQQAQLQPRLQWLKDAGVRLQEVDAGHAYRIEPALNRAAPLAGAVHFPDDDVGNTRQFALLLRNEALRRGAEFAFGTTVAALAPSARPGVLVAGEAAPRSFDAVVLCAGTHAAALLGPLGLRLPLAAVHGHSVSAPMREPLGAPHSAVVDAHSGIIITRLGQRVRAAGTAFLGGEPGVLRRDALRSLYDTLQEWFPGAAQLSSGVQEWQGARATLPSGPPVVGASGLPGLWLNLGHGDCGWTTSCASARVLADLVGGRAPEIDPSGFDPHRLRAH